MSSTFMTLDSRKRLNLATLSPRDAYVVTREKSGRIILDPAVVLTEDELAVLNNTALLTAAAAAAESTERRPRRRL